LEFKALVTHLSFSASKRMEIEMLDRDTVPTHRARWQWLARLVPAGRPAHQLTDIRDLSPYLRADIGAPGGSYPCRS